MSDALLRSDLWLTVGILVISIAVPLGFHLLFRKRLRRGDGSNLAVSVQKIRDQLKHDFDASVVRDAGRAERGRKVSNLTR